ncbi:hypothetical protein FV234_25785 [Methylobacterium sp. WL8]|nr:hypothetical protein FV234_25785 [Methylobacterium sp. WL8]
MVREEHVASILAQISKSYESLKNGFLRQFAQSQLISDKHIKFIREEFVTIILHSQANHFMRPIAHALANALVQAGVRTQICDENADGVEHATTPIIIAPHEFFTFKLPIKLDRYALIRKSILFNTEQIGSPWFSSIMGVIFGSRGVIDINFQSSEVFKKSNIPSCYVLPPIDRRLRNVFLAENNGQHPLFSWIRSNVKSDGFPDRPYSDRDLDLFFAGNKTFLRTRTIAKSAPYLASRNCFISYTDSPPSTIPTDDTSILLFSGYMNIVSNTKLVLALPRYSIGYFEWERFVAQGFANGACVIASNPLKSPFFEPDINYVDAPLRNLSSYLKWLLETRDGADSAQAIIDTSRQVLEEEMSPTRVGNFIVSFLSSLDKDQSDDF